MTYRLAIFDFDGVLADSLALSCEAINTLRDRQFPELPRVSNQRDLARLYCGPLRTSLRQFGLSDDRSKQFFDLHSAIMKSRMDEVRLFPEVLELFFSLPSAQRVIVTSTYGDAVRVALRRYAPSRAVANIQILGRELRIPKSKKMIHVVEASGLRRSDAIKIGDTVSDILSAREAGIDVCVVGWGYHPIEYLLAFDPTHHAKTPTALKMILGVTPLKLAS